MSDIILHSIKSFLYEKQKPERGRLDGTLYLFKGNININKNTKIHKSIFPTLAILERHRGPSDNKSCPSDNKSCPSGITYKLFINKNPENGNITLIKKKEDCLNYYFKEPEGAIHILFSIIQTRAMEFTLAIEGENIPHCVIHMNSFNYEIIEGHLRIQLMNILTHFRCIDFESHQLYGMTS